MLILLAPENEMKCIATKINNVMNNTLTVFVYVIKFNYNLYCLVGNCNDSKFNVLTQLLFMRTMITTMKQKMYMNKVRLSEYNTMQHLLC